MRHHGLRERAGRRVKHYHPHSLGDAGCVWRWLVISWLDGRKKQGLMAGGSLDWFGLVWFGLVWFGLVWLVWFGLLWFVALLCLVCFGLAWFGLLWFVLVWFCAYCASFMCVSDWRQNDVATFCVSCLARKSHPTRQPHHIRHTHTTNTHARTHARTHAHYNTHHAHTQTYTRTVIIPTAIAIKPQHDRNRNHANLM